MSGQGRFTKSSVVNNQAQDVVVPSGPSADRPEVPQAGSFRLNTTTSEMEFFDGSQYQSLSTAGFASITVDTFTGDNSTTTFTMTVTPNSAQGILVFIGNVYQTPTTHYTVSAADITFDEAPPSGETINVLHGFDSNSS